MRHPIPAFLLGVTFGSMAQAATQETLHFVEHPAHEVTTHLGKSNDAPGDLLTFANPVFDANNEHQVGSDQGFCIRVTPGQSWECFWTLLLRDGQITVEGPYLDSGDSKLAITGGTGRFAASRGDMTLHARSGQPATYDFVYVLRQ